MSSQSTSRLNVPEQLRRATKDVKNQAEVGKLVEAWNKAVVITATQKSKDGLPKGLHRFATHDIQAPLFSKHPPATFTIISDLLEDFYTQRVPRMITRYKDVDVKRRKNGSRPISPQLGRQCAEIRAAFKEYAEVIVGLVTALNNAWHDENEDFKDEIATHISSIGVKAIFLAAASWPDSVLDSDGRLTLVEFLVFYVKADRSIAKEIRYCKDHGLMNLGGMLNASKSTLLSCALLDLIIALLTDATDGDAARTKDCKEAFFSCRWMSDDAKDLRVKLKAAAGGHYHRNTKAILDHLTSLGGGRPQSFHVISLKLSEDESAAAEPEKSKWTIWLDPKTLIGRMFRQQLLHEQVFHLERVTLFRELRVEDDCIVYQWLYETIDGAIEEWRLAVERNSEFEEALKTRVDKLGLLSFFASSTAVGSAQPKFGITKYKASRASHPALDTHPRDTDRRKTEPARMQSSVQERQQQQKQLIEEDVSSSLSLPLSDLPPEKYCEALSHPPPQSSGSRKRKSSDPVDAVEKMQDDEARKETEEQEPKSPPKKTKLAIQALAAQHPKQSVCAPAAFKTPALKVGPPALGLRSSTYSQATRALRQTLARRMSTQQQEEPIRDPTHAPTPSSASEQAKLKQTVPPKTTASTQVEAQVHPPTQIITAQSLDALKTPAMEIDSDEEIAKGMDRLLGMRPAQGSAPMQPLPERREATESIGDSLSPLRSKPVKKTATLAAPKAPPLMLQQERRAPSEESSPPLQASWGLDRQPDPAARVRESQKNADSERIDPLINPPRPTTPLKASRTSKTSQVSKVKPSSPPSEASASPAKEVPRMTFNSKAKLIHKALPKPQKKIVASQPVPHVKKARAPPESEKQPEPRPHEALYRSLAMFNQEIEDAFTTKLKRMEEAGRMTRALMIQDGKDAILDILEQNTEILNYSYDMNVHLAKSEAQLLHVIQGATVGVGAETTKAIRAGKHSRWKWPDLKF